MILTLEEKRGGKKHLEQDNIKFQELIDRLNLVDIEKAMEPSLGPTDDQDINKYPVG
jgi:hypothetical protein